MPEHSKIKTTSDWKKFPAWIAGVGTEFNWQVIRANTEDEVREIWMAEHGNDGQSPDSVEVTRKEKWDGKEVTSRMWFNDGLGKFCHDCGYETWKNNGGIVDRNGFVVCEDCQEDRKIEKAKERRTA